MHFRSKILVSLVLGMALASCNDSEEKKASQQGGQTGPEWALSIQSTCLDGSKETCQGFYGFSVDATGKYEVGAELSDHPVRTRELSADEMKAIEELAAPYVAALKADTQVHETCTAREVDATELTQEHTVKLSRHGQTIVLARDSSQGFCTSLLEKEQTRKLVDQMFALASTHYPNPYPDSCLDEIDRFEAKYADLQSCSVATDCSYVSETFSVIPYDAEQVVFLEDYSKVPPIVVANASKMTSARAGLTEARSQLETSCSERFWRTPVPVSFRQFYSNAGNPVCEQNRCKVNPSVFSSR